MITTRPSAPLGVALVLLPRFPLLSLAICTEALRVANRECLHTAYAWTLVGRDGGPVTSSSGIPFQPTASIRDLGFSPVTVLFSSYEPEKAYSDALARWLRRQDRQGGIIGCVDTAALILAKAGLLAEHGASVHHEAIKPFLEEHRTAVFIDRLFAFEGNRLSSAGGMATLDMVLALIARTRGEWLADRVAEVMYYTRLPAARASQRGGRDTGLARVDRHLARCVALMEAHIEDPLPVEVLARRAQVPDWKLRRLFRRHLRTTPSRYYLDLRLERARQLLAYGHRPIGEVALACGFADTASFSHAFKRRHGVSPSKQRWAHAGA